jgi:hypothetical protein
MKAARPTSSRASYRGSLHWPREPGPRSDRCGHAIVSLTGRTTHRLLLLARALRLPHSGPAPTSRWPCKMKVLARSGVCSLDQGAPGRSSAPPRRTLRCTQTATNQGEVRSATRLHPAPKLTSLGPRRRLQRSAGVTTVRAQFFPMMSLSCVIVV